MAEILFHGAAGEVTGSMHLIRIEDRWVALDCGMFQGRRSESEEKNRTWPVPPQEIAAVVLSHAHIDHTGKLPRLARDGFEGPVYCTPATRDLCALMLPDSAHIQQEDVQYVNKKRKRRGLPPIEPLYEDADADKIVSLMQSIPYGRWFQVIPGLLARYQEAGHMLGSAGVELAFGKHAGNNASLFFTGDVGRRDKPILRDPAGFPQCETLICESTYGARVNESVGDARVILEEVVKRTVDRGGKVIIPAFSVGRTQTIVYYLQEMMDAGRLPCIPVYVDSPLSVNATEVFRMHPEVYDRDARALQLRTGEILRNQCMIYIRDVEQSKALHGRREPSIIISSSGMCEAGRIRHHLKNNIRDSRNTVFIPGYQAAHTLGRRLADGADEVRIFHEEFRVEAEVVQVHGFSGHADQADLLRMIEPLRGVAKRILLVHGEDEQRQVLADLLRDRGFNAELPTPGMRVALS